VRAPGANQQHQTASCHSGRERVIHVKHGNCSAGMDSRETECRRFVLEEVLVSRKDAKTQRFSIRCLCLTVDLPDDGIIAYNALFFFAFLASLREQFPTIG